MIYFVGGLAIGLCIGAATGFVVAGLMNAARGNVDE